MSLALGTYAIMKSGKPEKSALSELLVLNGVCAGTVFFLPEVPTVLGRSPEAHLQIADPWISSMHAMFEKRGDDIWVVDLESRNGTFVDEARVQESRIPPGGLLRFGKTEVRYEHRDDATRPERFLAEGGTVVRYLDDLQADMERARAGQPQRDTMKSDPGPPALARRQLAVLEEIGRALIDADNLDACLVRILTAVARAVRSERASLLLSDEKGEMVPRALEPAGSPPAISATVLSAAAQSRAGILTLDAQLDDRFAASQSIVTHGIRSAMCVPIWAAHRILGMLLFDRGPAEPFSPEDLELAAVVGHQAALAIERARFLEQARAGDDRRRAIEDQLPPEVARSMLGQDPGEGDPLDLAPRSVAVLRAALADAGDLAPAVAAELLRDGVEAMVGAALAEGGAAARVAGAGIVAVFGLIHPEPDAARRAVSAALAMRSRVAELPGGLGVRAGLAAGRALVGNVAGPRRFELAVAGGPADEAERLLAAAGRGEILASRTVRDGAPGLESAGRREVGGVAVEAFRAE